MVMVRIMTMIVTAVCYLVLPGSGLRALNTLFHSSQQPGEYHSCLTEANTKAQKASELSEGDGLRSHDTSLKASDKHRPDSHLPMNVTSERLQLLNPMKPNHRVKVLKCNVLGGQKDADFGVVAAGS